MQVLRDEVSIVFYNRCGHAPLTEAADERYRKVAKRVDFLQGQMRFMGRSSTKVSPDV